MELESELVNLDSLNYWVFADFDWVVVKCIRGNRSFLLYFQLISTILIGYSIIPLLFGTPCLNIKFGIPEK